MQSIDQTTYQFDPLRQYDTKEKNNMTICLNELKKLVIMSGNNCVFST